MDHQPVHDGETPIFRVVVDHLLVFTEQAVTDPAELATLREPRPADRVLVDTVDQFVQFTDRPDC